MVKQWILPLVFLGGLSGQQIDFIKQLKNKFFVDVRAYTGATTALKISAAAAAAGTNAILMVPYGMSSGDPTSLPAGTIVYDYRSGKKIRIFGGNDTGTEIKEIASFATNIGGDNPLGRFQIYSELGTVPLGAGYAPKGADLALLAQGAADLRFKTIPENLTSSNNIPGAGTYQITVNSTAGLYELAGLYLEPGLATEELISALDWSIINSTTLEVTTTAAHVPPYTVGQVGAIFFDGHDLITYGDDFYPSIRWRDKYINPYLYFPKDLGAAWPDNAIQFTGVVAGRGSNGDFNYRNRTTSSCFKLANSANTATGFSMCESSNLPVFYFGNTTGTVSLRVTADPDLPRITGGGTVKGIIFSAAPLTGETGIIRFRDNLVDENETFTHNTATGNTTTTKLTVGGDTTISAAPRMSWNAFFPGALTSIWTGAQFTPDKAITVTRIEAYVKTAPVTCSPNAGIQLAQGATTNNLGIIAASNDSGVLSTNYIAGTAITIGIVTAAAGCGASPADMNVTIQYKMQ